MTSDSESFRAPYQLIEALMRERGWTNRVLAVVLNTSDNDVSRIVTGKRAVDAELALTLEDVFGLRAEDFLDLQKSYDLAKARITARPDPERATRAHLFAGLPIAEMTKRGWIDVQDVRDAAKVQTELMRFFSANRVDDIEVLPHAAKKTQVNTDPTPAQLAWLYRVKQIADDMIVASYSPASVRGAIGKLKNLLSAPEEARKVPRILAEAGIRFALVETLPTAKIDGVCMWLNQSSPVIAMTMRYDRIDNFWFVLRHELEHVDRRHGISAAMLDTELEGARAGTGPEIAEEERIANEAASEFCVPKKMMDAFVARKAPFFHERDIIGFARSIGVHPGLIAGQLRHRLDRFDRFGTHLVKMRSLVRPGAVVDGWGDVAPIGA